MTQYQVTVNSENVQDLFTGDGLARLLENVLNQVLSAQAQRNTSEPGLMKGQKIDRDIVTATAAGS
jgi:hypothetical protein